MNIGYADAIARAKAKRQSDNKDANSLARKPKTRFVLPESRQHKQEMARLGDGINEILERAHCMGFLSEDDVRTKMRELSSLINTPRRAR